MTSRLPALTNLPTVVRKAAAAYNEGVTLLDKLDQDLAGVTGIHRQADAEHADQQVMIAALGRGEDPVLVGTPNEAARRAAEVYGRKAAAAQRNHVGQLEHALGLLLLEHRDAVLAHVDPQLDPAADAYRQAVEAMFAARSTFACAMDLRVWAVSIRSQDLVPHLGESGLGSRIQAGFADIDPDDLLAALRTDAGRATKDREVEAARAIRLAGEAAREAVSAAETAARKVIEDAQFGPDSKPLPRRPLAA